MDKSAYSKFPRKPKVAKTDGVTVGKSKKTGRAKRRRKEHPMK